MNRYRTIPGQGPQKAGASTVCQKCLKKGHYSYECKASTQERPYISRPSRTQQLLNPQLKPRLMSDTPNELLNSKGVADQQLSEAAARRNADSVQEPESRARSPSPGQRSRSRSRSRSADSSSSVSTISTNKSLSRSRTPSADRRDRFLTSEPASRARSRTPPRKRKHRSMSSSHSRTSRSPPRRLPGSHRKSRRHRTISPLDRGRPSSMRRGSHRSRSNSLSMDKSRITRHRRSLDSENEFEGDRRGYGKENRRHGQQEARKPVASRPSDKEPKGPRRDRSLSPFSKRLALTQAMNL